MRLFTRAILPAIFIVLMALPAFAQEAAAAAKEVPLAPIVLILSVLSALVPMTKLIPGWGTLSNIATGLVAALSASFTELAQAHPTLTISALLLSALGAVVGYFRSETRAQG